MARWCSSLIISFRPFIGANAVDQLAFRASFQIDSVKMGNKLNEWNGQQKKTSKYLAIQLIDSITLREKKKLECE